MATAAAAKDEQIAHRFAKDQLKAFVERVERLEEEKNGARRRHPRTSMRKPRAMV